MDSKEQPHYQAPSASLSGAEEAPDGGSKLAQSIWGRYGGSPGVIPIAVTLGLARRVAQLSAGRLPLLADLQQRWAPADVSFPRGWSSLPYAWWPAFAGTPSPSSYVARPAPETASPNFEPAHPIRPAAGVVSLRRTASTLPAEDMASPQPAAGEAQRPTEAQTASPTATSASNMGTDILQRYLDGPARRAIQRQVALPEPTYLERRMTADIRQSAGPPIWPGEGAPPPQPAAGEAQRLAQGRTEESIATSTGDLGAAILQRYLDGLAGRVMRPVFTLPELGRLEGRVSAGTYLPTSPSVFQGKGSSQPTTEARQYAAEAEAGMIAAANTGDLGAAILQRYLDGPAGRVMQQVFASPEPGRLEGRGTAVVQQRAGGPLTSLGRSPGGTARARTPIVQATTFRVGQETPVSLRPGGLGSVRLALAAFSPRAVTGSMATIQRQMGEAVHLGTAEAWQAAEDTRAYVSPAELATPGASRHAVSSPTTSLGGARAAPGPAMPLLRSAVPGAGMLTEAWRSSGIFSTTLTEMPLFRAMGRSGSQAATGGTTMIQAQPDSPGAALAMPLQRAAADTSAAMPATETPDTVPSAFAEEPSSPTMAQPGLEGLDLERLADEVYAIIERRLTIERESLGL